MVKIIIVLVSFVFSLLTSWFVHFEKLYVNILLFIAFFIGYILVQAILFFLVAFILSIPISKKRQTIHYSRFYRFVLYAYTKFCLSLFGVKTKVKGMELLPQNGNFVLLYNHRSNLDSMIIDVFLHKYPLVFVAKQSLFGIPFFGKFIHKIGYLKLDRGNIRQELLSIYQGIDFLNKNECSVGVAPEGTRNFTKEDLLPFKVGCLHLATKAKKPIVICILTDTIDIKKHILTKRHPVTLRIVEVIEYQDFEKMHTRELAEIIREKMLQAIKEEQQKR